MSTHSMQPDQIEDTLRLKGHSARLYSPPKPAVSAGPFPVAVPSDSELNKFNPYETTAASPHLNPASRSDEASSPNLMQHYTRLKTSSGLVRDRGVSNTQMVPGTPLVVPMSIAIFKAAMRCRL